MKKIKLLVAALIFSAVTVFANTNDDNLKKQIKSQVSVLLEKVPFQVSEDLKAQVEFVVTKKGEIIVTSVVTKDEQVVDYVKSRLNYKKVFTKSSAMRVYKMPLTIRKS